MNAIAKHHQTGRDGSGFYFTRLDDGQAIDMSTLNLCKTIVPKVIWQDDSGTVTDAWHGSAWAADRQPARARKQAQLAANQKLAELRRYLMINDRRWEVVKDEERAREKARKDYLIAAAKRLREAGPDLLAACKQIVTEIDGMKLDPLHPLMIHSQPARDAIAKAEGGAS